MLPKPYTTLLLAVLTFYRCAENSPIPTEGTSGEFTLLTYNVAGLPQGISPSNPKKNIPIISPKLNKFDIALVQEDFVYHEELKSKANHLYQSQTQIDCLPHFITDGLNRFSKFPFTELYRKAWETCSNDKGNDCLAAKGFTLAKTEIAPGVFIDIYNLHLDSGGSPNDTEARRSQVAQLLKAISIHSLGNAVIIAGDLNLNTTYRPNDVEIFKTLLTSAGLTDVCRSLSCGTELVDRVLFRNSNSLTLKAVSWELDENFVDVVGQHLSDHSAVSVRFKWNY
jgi:endonuclease/exonuclease/phosphatase family metal-dependent hydrolase